YRITQLTTDRLPLLSVLYVSPTEIVAAGHDCCPYQFSYKGPGALELVKNLDIPKQTSKGIVSAKQHFLNLDKKATEEDNNEMETLHQNSITQLCIVSGEKAKVEKYSSVGLDGAMVIWDFKVRVSNSVCLLYKGEPIKTCNRTPGQSEYRLATTWFHYRPITRGTSVT
uniref:Uncharacterized protein n=1 Tax=Mola mola TaxID=94237 RepID=A0A3Q4B4E0_MOLML